MTRSVAPPPDDRVALADRAGASGIPTARVDDGAGAGDRASIGSATATPPGSPDAAGAGDTLAIGRHARPAPACRIGDDPSARPSR